ncbi:MAG: hypothetical protein WCX17_04315 [Parcubacteria group bacterium]
MAVLILFSFLFFPAHKSEAAAWPAIDPVINSALTKIMDQIKAMLLGVAKQAAIKAIQEEMTYLITGKSSGGAMFVTDWNDYLKTRPQAAANLVINDYISQSLRGRGSLVGYVSATTAQAEGVGMSYVSQLGQWAQNSTSDQQVGQVMFTGNPTQIFSGRQPFQQMNLYFSGVNNPWAFSMDVQARYQEEIARQERIAEVRVISGQGFPGNDSDGMTITPGALIKDQLAKVQSMGVDMIATARELPELITSVVSMTISQTIQQGIGNLQSQVHREITNVRNNAKNQMNQTIRNIGPAAYYKF